MQNMFKAPKGKRNKSMCQQLFDIHSRSILIKSFNPNHGDATGFGVLVPIMDIDMENTDHDSPVVLNVFTK